MKQKAVLYSFMWLCSTEVDWNPRQVIKILTTVQLYTITVQYSIYAVTCSVVTQLRLQIATCLAKYVVMILLFINKYMVSHKSVKHFKNLQQINYSTDYCSSYADRERNSPSFFFYIFHRCLMCPPLVIQQTSMQ